MAPISHARVRYSALVNMCGHYEFSLVRFNERYYGLRYGDNRLARPWANADGVQHRPDGPVWRAL
jgi:hypothetical protein